jgi:hypothetical protein
VFQARRSVPRGAQRDRVDDALEAMAAAAGAQLRQGRCQARIVEKSSARGRVLTRRQVVRVACHGLGQAVSARQVARSRAMAVATGPGRDARRSARRRGPLRSASSASILRPEAIRRTASMSPSAAALVQASRQALRAAVARQQVQVDLRLAEAGLRRRRRPQAQASTSSQPPPSAGPLTAAITGLPRFSSGEGRVRRVRRRLCRLEVAGLADLQQFLDVGAGNEGIARAGDDQALDAVLLCAMCCSTVFSSSRERSFREFTGGESITSSAAKRPGAISWVSRRR